MYLSETAIKTPPPLPDVLSFLKVVIFLGKISDDNIELSNEDSVPITISAPVESTRHSNSVTLLQIDLQFIFNIFNLLAGFVDCLVFLIGDEVAIGELKD